MKCTELVIYDHLILRRGLDILDAMVKKLMDGERIEIADVTAILEFFRVFGIEYHQTMEEKVLFPALQRAAPQESVLLQMLLEHGEERAIITAIQDALRSKRGMDFVNSSRRLSILLRNRFDKVVVVLRQIAERTLLKEEDNAFVSEFTNNYKQPETYGNFARLERKYAPKPHVTELV